MEFGKRNINKASRNGSLNISNAISISGAGGVNVAAQKLEKWFYEDDEGNLHSKLDFVGDLSVSALGVSEDTGSTVITIDIIDNLTSDRTDAALSANQGRVLNEKIEEVKQSIETGGTGEASWLNLRDKPELLTDANIQKWDEQSHKHDNKTVLDAITEENVTNWNNTVNQAHKHDNKTVLDTITQTKVNNWDDVYTDFNDVFSIEGDILRVKLNLVGEKQVSAYGFSDDTGGVVTVDVIDNLTSTRTDAALSANMGRQLKSLIDSKSSVSSWDDLTDKPSTFPPSPHTHNYVTTVKVGDTSYYVSDNTIGLPAYPTIPTSLKNPYALTISLNGTSQGAYDGSAAKSINITASSVGAAASSHTHTKSQITDFPTTWAWGSITGKPTTLSGYGITDGVNAVSVTGGGNAITAASVAGHTLTLTKGSTFLLSSQYTASDILTKLKTVDGAGSGLDSDLLDGLDWNNFFSRKFYTINLSSYSTSNFYPLVFSASDIELDCEIHSNNVGGDDKFNQNRMHFQLTTQGWTDTGVSFRILSRNNYTDSEVTIGSIGRGTQTGGAAIWVRGGRTYRIYANREPVFKSSNYTYGTEVYSVGTNLYGGTNTNVDIIWKNDSTRDNNVLATVNGTVAAADKLTSSAGSSTTPVYFSSGKPVSCSYSFGNGSGNAAISNGTLCTNLNADKLDGTDKSGLLTSLSSSSSTNISITVGGTTKSISDLYATYTERLLNSRTFWGQSFNGTSNVSGNMTGVGSITASGNITTTANITANGTVVAKTASDARLKDIIKTKKTYQQRLLQLGKIVDFQYNKAAKDRNKNGVDDNKHIGLIYQNVANSDLSNFAYKEDDGFGAINYLSTDYINLIAGAVQELIKENKKLKRELNKLKKIIEENELQ